MPSFDFRALVYTITRTMESGNTKADDIPTPIVYHSVTKSESHDISERTLVTALQDPRNGRTIAS